MRYEVVNNSDKNLIVNIKEEFDKSNSTLFKSRNIIKIVRLKSKEFTVKSFKIPNFINKIAYRYFRDSKAKRSYFNSIKLQELGVNTPAPIGYIEFGKFTLQESFYISEFFEHNFEIRAVLNDIEFKNREQILKELALFSYNLHNSGVYHMDYSPGNILVKEENSSYKFAIIDVNRMKFIKYSNELRFKNLSKLFNRVEDIKFIASEYAKISGIDEKFAQETLLKYYNKHQAYLQRKKRLKALKGIR